MRGFFLILSLGLLLPFPSFFDGYGIVYYEKVAIVIEPSGMNNPIAGGIMQDTTQLAELILDSLGYTVFKIVRQDQIRAFMAKQTIIFYAGHGLDGGADLLYTPATTLNLSQIIKPIISSKLILMNSACFGGAWMKYAALGRLIISASNDTTGLILGELVEETEELLMFPPSLVDLLFYCTLFSVEQSFRRWAPIMKSMYEHNGNETITGPIMYDGIQGEVYL